MQGCSIQGCHFPETRIVKGLCMGHYWRRWKRGTTDLVHQQYGQWGEENPAWKGASAKYSAVHNRLARRRGKATDHACALCGAPARQWALRKDAKGPILQCSDRPSPYSENPADYFALCVRCHQALDGTCASTLRWGAH
jgi:hypothetical protein